MKNYNKLLEYGIAKHNETIEQERVEIPLLYFGSILASMANLKVYIEENDKLENANFFGMTFLPSGAGKDFALKVYRDLFKDIISFKHVILSSLVGSIFIDGSETGFPQHFVKKINKWYSVSVESSNIGIYIQALAVQCAKWGSINIEINEFADHIGKSENINMMKELYDGEMKARLVLGDKDDESRQNISNVHCNAMIYGTPYAIKQDKQRMRQFKELTSSGMYRRSIVYFSEPKRTNRKDTENIDVSSIINGIKNRLKLVVDINRKTKAFELKNEFTCIPLTNEAKAKINEIAEYLHKQHNDSLYDEFKALDKFSHKLIEKVATIVSFIDLSDTVELCHVEYAYDLFIRTRATVSALFESIPMFEKIYKVVSMSKEPIASTTIMKHLAIDNPKELTDNVKYVQELAYINNKVLVQEGLQIVKFRLENLPVTDLNKIKISIGCDMKMEASIDFMAREVPFFGEGYSVENLVKSDEVQCFCTAWFKESSKAPHGHRREDDFIEGQNIIAFDFDTGITIDEAKEKFDGLTYLLYTTKSHLKEGKGERFRVLIPTSTEFFVNPGQHKMLYENIANAFNVTAYDKATRNVSRLWFTNKEAIVEKNIGQLLDVTKFLPETVTQKGFNRNMSIIEGETDNRIKGFLRWFLAVTSNGNRNVNLFKFKKFLDDLKVEPKEYIEKYNAMLDEPLPEKELRVILRSK